MAKHINEDLLIEKMSRLRGCSCSYSDGIIDEIEDIMSDIPTTDVVEREKLKEILDGYDGSIPSMITQFSKIQKLIESEETDAGSN